MIKTKIKNITKRKQPTDYILYIKNLFSVFFCFFFLFGFFSLSVVKLFFQSFLSEVCTRT